VPSVTSAQSGPAVISGGGVVVDAERVAVAGQPMAA
jgi:hypothetical protein